MAFHDDDTSALPIPNDKYGLWAYGVVVSMFDFHCSDGGSNPGRGSKNS